MDSRMNSSMVSSSSRSIVKALRRRLGASTPRRHRRPTARSSLLPSASLWKTQPGVRGRRLSMAWGCYPSASTMAASTWFHGSAPGRSGCALAEAPGQFSPWMSIPVHQMQQRAHGRPIRLEQRVQMTVPMTSVQPVLLPPAALKFKAERANAAQPRDVPSRDFDPDLPSRGDSKPVVDG